MKFTLFSKEEFNVTTPEALIESCCIQSDFYTSFDIVEDKNILHVNKIGARAKKDVLNKCHEVLGDNHAEILNYDIDTFLDLPLKAKGDLIRDLDENIISKMLKIKGMRISRVTKVFHTLYPDIFPMIDNPLQDFYKERINSKWKPKSIYQLLYDFYENLCIQETRQNIDKLSKQLSHLSLTKIRIFDIIWWSYMKSMSGDRAHITWKMFK